MKFALLLLLFFNFYELHFEEIVIEEKIQFHEAQISKYLHKKLKCGTIIILNEYKSLMRKCTCNQNVIKMYYNTFFHSSLSFFIF